ncbi:hypothetical protein D3C72_2222720 [compost metagenome]
MTAHCQPVLPGKSRQLVRLIKGVYLLLRMHTLKLHFILCSDTVKMIRQQLLMGTDRQRVYRCADFEIIREHVL